MNAKRSYNGPERRARPVNDRRCGSDCVEHSGIVERLLSVEQKTKAIEKADYLTTSNYWLSTGLLVSILIAVLSASVYATFQASEALREVKAAQVTLSVQIGYLQRDIEAIKRQMP